MPPAEAARRGAGPARRGPARSHLSMGIRCCVFSRNMIVVIVDPGSQRAEGVLVNTPLAATRYSRPPGVSQAPLAYCTARQGSARGQLAKRRYAARRRRPGGFRPPAPPAPPSTRAGASAPRDAPLRPRRRARRRPERTLVNGAARSGRRGRGDRGVELARAVTAVQASTGWHWRALTLYGLQREYVSTRTA